MSCTHLCRILLLCMMLAGASWHGCARAGEDSMAMATDAADARAASAAAAPVRPATLPAASGSMSGNAVDFPFAGTKSAQAGGETALALRIVLGLTLITLLPSLLVSLTAFLRIIIVLSMLRHAIGMQETPPNTVMIGLALFMTLFTMAPVLENMNREAFQPFMQGRMAMDVAYEKGSQPLRAFLVRQTREQDLALMVELSRAPAPQSMDDISNVQLIPAFMLSELRAAFQIGFVIFLPFLLIDLIVSSVLMGLGMMMMPPVSIALPIKILMFVLIDGWSLVMKALVGSFH